MWKLAANDMCNLADGTSFKEIKEPDDHEQRIIRHAILSIRVDLHHFIVAT